MIEIQQNGVTLSDSIPKLIQKALETTLRMEKASGDVTVSITTEEAIQTLNREFRHVDRVTDVLTFPAWEGDCVLAPPDGYLGDIAICMKRAEEQAVEYGHSIEREFSFLAVHGGLHLLGYDHMNPEEEAVMLGKQKQILEEMGQSR